MKFNGEAFLVAPTNRNYGRRMLKIRKNVDSSPTSKTYDKVYKFDFEPLLSEAVKGVEIVDLKEHKNSLL
jgi:hypothetical protein